MFRGISFSLSAGDSLAITGRNGSGKSTLIKILAGLLSPTSGTVRFTSGGSMIDADELRQGVGFVSPYLQLYDEFTPHETLSLISRIRSGSEANQASVKSLLEEFGLLNRRDDEVRTFSSGMKQRLKYVAALAHDPWFLLLDEPTSNLDAEGSAVVKAVAQRYAKRGILVVATNDEQEAAWCARSLRMETADRPHEGRR